MKKIFISLVIIALVIAGAAAFIIINSKPERILSEQAKEQALGQILGRKPNLNSDVVTGNERYEGKLASFSYPARAKIYDYKGAMQNNDIETFSFDLENPRIVLNYSAEGERTDLKSLQDIPAVKMRQDLSNGYKQSTINADGREGLAFAKEGYSEYRAEKSGFFLDNGRSYSFSATGTTIEDVSKLFDEIVKSIEFTN